MGRRFMPAVTERIEAGGGAAKIDDDQKKSGERIDTEMGAEPGQAERQNGRRRRGRAEQAIHVRRPTRITDATRLVP